MDKYLNQVVCKSAIDLLKDLPDQSVHCIITSPPYYGLRSYLDENDPSKPEEVGAEQTPEQYVEKLVEVFHEARRVLRDDGTLWLNLGDSYARQAGNDATKETDSGMRTGRTGKSSVLFKNGNNTPPVGYKAKDLLGIPFQVAFALQADGWYWRSTIPWVKRNAMPESVKDRPTSGIEYVFMFSKSQKYYYDYSAVQRPLAESSLSRIILDSVENLATGIRFGGNKSDGYGNKIYSGKKWIADKTRRYRNTDAFYDSLDILIEETQEYLDHLRKVKENRGVLCDEEGEIIALDIPTRSFKAAHFATFPTTLVEPLLIAGCPAGGIVLDFFSGAGTIGLVAVQSGRQFICGDLNPEYVEMAQKRILDGSGWS